jgi:hypothetical protein
MHAVSRLREKFHHLGQRKESQMSDIEYAGRAISPATASGRNVEIPHRNVAHFRPTVINLRSSTSVAWSTETERPSQNRPISLPQVERRIDSTPRHYDVEELARLRRCGEIRLDAYRACRETSAIVPPPPHRTRWLADETNDVRPRDLVAAGVEFDPASR